MPATQTTSAGFALQHVTLTAPPVHIPDGNGGAFKTELVIERSPERTVKLVWWYADDPRTEPHNHPWPFRSEILAGGYTDDRYWFECGKLCHEQREHRAGDFNEVPRTIFHNVSGVIPGTVTRMTCGPVVDGGQWNHLDIATGELLTSDDPEFVTQLRALNPHLRSK